MKNYVSVKHYFACPIKKKIIILYPKSILLATDYSIKLKLYFRILVANIPQARNKYLLYLNGAQSTNYFFARILRPFLHYHCLQVDIYLHYVCSNLLSQIYSFSRCQLIHYIQCYKGICYIFNFTWCKLRSM